MILPFEAAENRDRWRVALDEYIARKERTRALRAQLAEARTAGKARRHADRLARLSVQKGPTP